MTKGMKFTTPRHRKVYVAYEALYDCVDALAAILFIVGSILFFRDATQTAGTWLFLIGSVCFAIRPVVHVVRDVHMGRISRMEAERPDSASQP